MPSSSKDYARSSKKIALIAFSAFSGAQLGRWFTPEW